jgi:hypothetical protein
MPKHRWQSVNRDRHSLESLTRPDLLHEIGCVLSEMTDDEFSEALELLDNGEYDGFGHLISDVLYRGTTNAD